MRLYHIKPLPLKNVVIDDSFWGRYIEMVRKKMLPYQWETLNDRVPDAARSHCIKNFEIAAGRRQGQFYGMVFQDSDLYKWLESVALCLETHPDPNLERLADEAIELIGAAQGPDGYVNTYYTVREPEGRWTNLQQGHELYCAGHMIEAATAYFKATGKPAFLDIAIRFADCIDRVFGDGDGKLHGYPGHQEIELALFKLYETTNELRYLKLMEYFIRQRGATPNYFDEERLKPEYWDIFPELKDFDRSYSQSHAPPVNQREAVGHAVRAMYMYSAMADLAAELKDEQLTEACEALFENLTGRRMYITGAVGSCSVGESFTADYDLPDDLVYGETCAAIGLMMFSRRMNALKGEARFADTMERALYNTVISGMSLEGTEFFYVNPLEVVPSRVESNPCFKHVKPVRQKWFECSCCPTNMARTVMGLGGYAYAASEEGIYVNLYCGSTARDGERSVTVSTDYPYGGKVSIVAEGGRYRLFLRNPENAPVISLTLNGEEKPVVIEKGYVVLEADWRGDKAELLLDVRPKLIYTATEAGRNVGKAAVMRGPLVYCMEGKDNGDGLSRFMLKKNPTFGNCPSVDGLPPGTVALTAPAYKYEARGEGLYMTEPPVITKTEVKLIPYYLWANRGNNEMRVHINVEPIMPEASEDLTKKIK